MAHPPSNHRLLAIALAAAGITLAGCNKTADTPATAPAPAPAATAPAEAAPAPVAAAPAVPSYTPPTADQLYQMVAPIALYPDKLVAQVLAGSTYPAQVTDADQWLHQNASLKAGPLADAADRQPWDPSIKSLTAFRSVLDQMAKNLPWTTALGEAYYNDPSDVMNAIQVMRQRASRAGQLKSTPQLKVATGNPQINYTPNPNVVPVYSGQAVVEPPTQYITIAPAQPDVVYVPAYDPQRIYGEPVRVYPGYVYAPPQPVYSEPRYSNAQIATAGALTFGLGVVVGSALERHDWGWHSWGVNWGSRGDDRRPPPGRDGRSYEQPAVVYNRSTYVSRSETVVNNNIRNVYNNGPAPRGDQAQQAQLEHQAQQVQMQRDQVQREQQRNQAQMQMAQVRQQQQQQEQVRQQQARDQQMQAQQHRNDQARQQQEQQRQQQMQMQAQQQDQARHQQEQLRHQQEQTQQQRADQARQQQERARQQQEQQRQQQEQARHQQEQQRQQAEQQSRQMQQQRQQAEQQQRQQQQQAEQQARQQQQQHLQHEQQAQQHRQQEQHHAEQRAGERRQAQEQKP
ncbi:DUF3300 domain-containing protein [Variovorax ginsengisoli]|uniref:DUF3300 domain-containing protein n=1 Tax=Variovorax ginsengisoli TaxID=363844 RepID=A0ABT9S415_9BURK|nr:DUF3300 domain-containing protein [Variovorax ginsengisoli]MDP9898117.1 hypothetical protein [Variovorax ginsengisoli]